jgi:hypothetical protein
MGWSGVWFEKFFWWHEKINVLSLPFIQVIQIS